jgi:hypothetical protein
MGGMFYSRFLKNIAWRRSRPGPSQPEGQPEILASASGARFESSNVGNQLVARNGIRPAVSSDSFANQSAHVGHALFWRGVAGEQALQAKQPAMLDLHEDTVWHAEQIILDAECGKNGRFQAHEQLFTMRRCIGVRAIDLGTATPYHFLGLGASELLRDKRRTERALQCFHILHSRAGSTTCSDFETAAVFRPGTDPLNKSTG